MTENAFLKRTLFSPAAALFVLIGLVYGIHVRQTAPLAVPGVWDVLISVVTSPAVLVYVMLPAWLLYSVLASRFRFETAQLVRYGSYIVAWRSSLLSACKIYFSVALFWVLALYLSSIGLRLQQTGLGDPLSKLFRDAGLNPALVVLLQACFLAIPFLAIYAIVVVVRLVTGAAIFSVVLAIVFFLWVAASERGAIGLNPIVNASNYLQAETIVTSPPTAIGVVIGSLVIVLASAFASVELDRRHQRRGIQFDNAWFLFWAISVVILTLAMRSTIPSKSAYTESLAIIFIGNSGTILQNMISLFIYIGSSFMLAYRLSKAGEGWRDLQLVRYGSTVKWTRAQLHKIAPRILMTLAIVTLICAAAYSSYGGRFLESEKLSLAAAAYQLFVNGFLQAFLFAQICLYAFTLRGLKAPALTAVALLLVFSSIPMSPDSWWPFGAASFAKFEVGYSSIIVSTISLGVTNLAVGSAYFTWIKVRTSKFGMVAP
ncbi:MAG: hypothetical protein ABI072_05765 [Edaphobacter sp.]